jgi:methionyl aminopeptidase
LNNILNINDRKIIPMATDYINKMRIAGKMASSVLDMIESHVKSGISTEELNDICHQYIVNVLNAVPAPLNYKGFPRSICTSVNNIVCHGIPNPVEILKDGDIINIDVTVIKDGHHGDTSRMYYVGSPSEQAKTLCDVSKECLYAGINAVGPGVELNIIGNTIQPIADKHGFTVVKGFCGHGIGLEFHEWPMILHYEHHPKSPIILREGMTFTIEPMINVGKEDIYISGEDGWTVFTQDDSLSAQWEHTLLINQNGCEILTQS